MALGGARIRGSGGGVVLLTIYHLLLKAWKRDFVNPGRVKMGPDSVDADGRVRLCFESSGLLAELNLANKSARYRQIENQYSPQPWNRMTGRRVE